MGEKDRAGAMFTLDELAQTIDQRAGTSAETSYTRSLIDKGAAHCARKFGEEAIEFAIAAAAIVNSMASSPNLRAQCAAPFSTRLRV